ncbi:helix-turn-helix domain-containing protein [Mucilaginibacter ginkgonis]|uniref:Helix-turn-helix domain-containing protein n=1 Tax=Mucilaginibacter ginkgonis TaxID=2682091 RepID=A0A6I4HU86_9SPHI|nr:helix-turn-helix domain-containing protein [Mucilaginibacter ginkgonis]QQL50282.1 helix-turn-helix domain-containing protein [Mucilaginibacter ginkgonis]
MEKINKSEERERRLYRDQLITVGDFLDLKDQLLAEFRNLIRGSGTHAGQKWLKAMEVRKLLKISAGKLQYLRDKGKIPFTKLGGVTYYDCDKIEKMMEAS